MYTPTPEVLQEAQELGKSAGSTLEMARSLTIYAADLSAKVGRETKDILAGLLRAGAAKPHNCHHTRET